MGINEALRTSEERITLLTKRPDEILVSDSCSMPSYVVGQVKKMRTDNVSFSSLPLMLNCDRPLNLSATIRIISNPIPGVKMEWPAATLKPVVTETDVLPTYNKFDEDTEEFIEQRHLYRGVAWLQTVVPDFFHGAYFEIEVLTAEDDEDNMLALRVYSSLSTVEFRKQMHALCKAMREAGHGGLYEVISIFQRRSHNDGRKAISWYRSLSKA